SKCNQTGTNEKRGQSRLSHHPQLASHGLIRSLTTRIGPGPRLLVRLDALKIDLVCHVVEEVCYLGATCQTRPFPVTRYKRTYRARIPPSAAILEPAQVSTQRRCQEDGVGVLLKLLERYRLLDGNL